MDDELLKYNLGEGVEAFSTQRDAALPYPVIQGHQVHWNQVAIVDRPGLTREELEDARGEDPMHFFTRVAALIDRRIADSYEIMATSRMAYSILKKSNAMRQDWAQDEANFMRHIEDQCGLDADREAMRQRLLEIYAAPIFNRQIK